MMLFVACHNFELLTKMLVGSERYMLLREIDVAQKH